MNEVVNSQAYWSHRFQGNWEDKGGREQSRFFCRLALREMPGWLKAAIRRNKLTVCDWGCALGDGTDILAQALDTIVTGIDFSEVAISKAQERYPNPRFLVADLLTESTLENWHVVFSSNTLEHFRDPWSALKRIARFATSVVIVLLPYREFERYSEHEYTFLDTNIPLSVDAFHLRHVTLIDAGVEPASMWSGEQILLVYTSRELVEELNLSLSDMRIDGDWTSKELERLRREAASWRARSERAELDTIEAVRDVHCKQEAALSEAVARWATEMEKLRRECQAYVLAKEGYIASLIDRSESLKRTVERQDDYIKDKEIYIAALASQIQTYRRRLIPRVSRLTRHIPHLSKAFVQTTIEWGVGEALSKSGRKLASAWRRARRWAISSELTGWGSPPVPIECSVAGLSSLHASQPFNPYDLIQLLKPIEVEVIEREFTGKIEPFTCVTTVRNEANSIERFLRSIARQTVLPRELVIVDGGSTDGTLDIVIDVSKDSIFPLRVIEAGDVNIARGRNIGCDHVATDIIVFLDGGCELDERFLANLVGPYSGERSPDLVGGIYRATRDGPHARPFIYDWISPDMDWENFIPSARSLSVRTDLFHKVGGFPEYLSKTGEDTLFGVACRKMSEKWVINKSACVLWEAPTTRSAQDRLMYSYAYGDGESGVGDFRFYSSVLHGNPMHPQPAPIREGYLAGRQGRVAIDMTRRKIRGLVVLLSGVPFTDSGGGQRCSQLAMAMARRGYKVIFVNIYPSFEKNKPIFVPADYTLFEFYALREFSADELVRRYGSYFNLRTIILVEFPHPDLISVIDRLKSGFGPSAVTLYDYIDNWRTSLGWEWYAEATEEKIINRANVLIASATTLQMDLARRTGRPVALVQNAANVEVFDPTGDYPRPPDFPPYRKKVVIYIGALWGEWFDWTLLGYACAELKEFTFLLIGGGSPQKIQEFAAEYKNVLWLGLKQQRELPAYLAHADVGIIPFTIDEITQYVNPVKIYEYLTMRVPVVATDLPEIRDFPGVAIARSREQFVAALRTQNRSRLERGAVDGFVEANGWDSRVSKIESIL